MRLRTAILPLTMPLLLAACLGSGGSNGPSAGQSSALTLNSTPTGTFTSMADLEAETLFDLEAPGDAAFNYQVATGGNGIAVDPTGQPSPPTRPVDGDESFEPSTLRILMGEGPDPEIDAIRLTVNFPDDPPRVTDFTGDVTEIGHYRSMSNVDGAGETTDTLLVYVGNDHFAPLAPVHHFAPEYMTFGIWGLGIGEAAVDLGAAAWGAPTDPTTMPDGTTAHYVGGLLGHFISLAGTHEVFEATSFVHVDFAESEVELGSFNTRVLGTDGMGSNDRSWANLSTVSAATIGGNTFGGGEVTLDFVDNWVGLGAPPDLDGQFGGAFFGPNAAEVGGWFSILNNDDGGRYFGSFGGVESVL